MTARFRPRGIGSAIFRSTRSPRSPTAKDARLGALAKALGDFELAARDQAAAQQVLLSQGRPSVDDLGLRRRGAWPRARATPRICSRSTRSSPATRPRRRRARQAASSVAGLSAGSPSHLAGGAPAPGAMTQLLLFNVTNGLIIGAFYVLMALGLSLILNLSGVINFAHGGFPRHRRLSRLYDNALSRLLGRAADRAAAHRGDPGFVVERVLIRRSMAAIRSTACS